LRNVTVHVENSKDIKIIGNTIYIFEGENWLSVENSTVTEKDNTIVTLPSSGGNQIGEEKPRRKWIPRTTGAAPNFNTHSDYVCGCHR